MTHATWNWSRTLADLRATQGWVGAVTGTGTVVAYTVPAGKRFILKSVSVQHTSAGSVNIQMRLAGLGTFFNWVLGAYQSGSDRTTTTFWIVLNPGDVLTFNNLTTGHTVIVTVSGSLHTI